MDERGCRIWLEKLWKPHAINVNRSYLLLDEFRAHMQSTFTDKVNDLGTDVDFIPGGYASVLQPCDVGINKTFKGYMKDKYMTWCVEKYRNNRDIKLPFPKRADIVGWTNNAWKQFSYSLCRNLLPRVWLLFSSVRLRCIE